MHVIEGSLYGKEGNQCVFLDAERFLDAAFYQVKRRFTFGIRVL